MFISFCVSASSSSKDPVESKRILRTSVDNIYGTSKIEITDIEGVYYTYHYYYNNNGMKAISITNENSNTTDVLTYDDSDLVIYLNDQSVATVKNVLSNSRSDLNSVTSSPYYGEYMGSYSQEISWVAGAEIAVVAAAIAIALASSGGAGVISAMRSGVLGTLAACGIGGTVSGTWYRSISAFSIVNTDVWIFTASTGEIYGPYVTLYAL